MKRNIIGLVVFSLIIGAAVFVKSALSVRNPVNYDYAARRDCPLHQPFSSELNSPQSVGTVKLSVKQAVLNLKTMQINWEVAVPLKNSLFALHFFVKDNHGTRYLASELGPMSSFGKTSSDTGALEFTSSYLWLDNLGHYQNLYVVPEQVSFSDYQSKHFSPQFDENAAIPVLLYSGR